MQICGSARCDSIRQSRSQNVSCITMVFPNNLLDLASLNLFSLELRSISRHLLIFIACLDAIEIKRSYYFISQLSISPMERHPKAHVVLPYFYVMLSLCLMLCYVTVLLLKQQQVLMVIQKDVRTNVLQNCQLVRHSTLNLNNCHDSYGYWTSEMGIV